MTLSLSLMPVPAEFRELPPRALSPAIVLGANDRDSVALDCRDPESNSRQLPIAPAYIFTMPFYRSGTYR
jgi:hypothetical protein